jgi:hypothetical protein
VQVSSESIVTVAVEDVPLHEPDQPEKYEPESAVAVRVTDESLSKSA